MNLLIVCPHFQPDVAPTGEVMTAIVRELAARGHRLQIVTSLPWYRHHRIDDGWSHRLVQTEETEWGWITRLHPFPTDKSNLPARAMAFGGFTALSAAVASVAKMRPDAVLAMSPPLILGGAGWLAARRWRVPFVFNIQDVFPDVAVEVGAITNPKVIAAASWIERFLYLRSDAVTVLSDDLRANLAAKLGARRPERVRVIPNFVDTAAITPADRITPYRAELGLGDRTVVMYAGNLGYSQSVGLLAWKDVLRDFWKDFSAHVEEIKDLRVSEVLATGDLHTVLLKTGLARSSVPSKMYSILAAGRPCLASVDLDTEVDRTLRDANAGRVAAPDDVDAFVATLGEMLDRRDDWAGWGRSGRHWVEEWLSPAAVAESYEQLFEELAGRRSGESSSLR